MRDYGLGVLKFHALLVGCDYFPGVHQVGNVKSISILMDAYNQYTRLPTTALLDHLLTAIITSTRQEEAKRLELKRALETALAAFNPVVIL